MSKEKEILKSFYDLNSDTTTLVNTKNFIIDTNSIKSTNSIELMLSYSRISDFYKNGPKALIKKTILEGEGIQIGSLVNDLLLDEQVFDNKYFIFNGSKPTATLGKLCDIIINNYNIIPNDEDIIKIAKDNNFWSKYSDEVLKKTIFTTEFKDYINSQYLSKTKTLITTDDLILANDIKDTLLTHNFSKHIFNNDYDNYNEFKFVMKYKNFNIRGILDRIIVNHENKTVQFIDLKTGANNAEEFENSFIKFKYYFQSALYTNAHKVIFKELEIPKDYKLLPFQFLYIGRYQKIPLVYTVSKKWYNAAFKGFKMYNNIYKGIDTLLDEIEWHYNNRIFDVSKFIYESNGQVELNDKTIEVLT